MASGPIYDPSIKLSQKDMGKEGMPSDSISSIPVLGDTTSQTKKMIDKSLISEQNLYYPPYYYPGYNGTFAQSDEKGFMNTSGGSYTGVQSDNPGFLYYIPGYGPYIPGYMGADGKMYGSEVFPSYTYDPTYAGNGSSSRTKSGSMMGYGYGKSNRLNAAKTNNNFSSKSSALPLNSKSQDYANDFSKFIYQNQLKSIENLGRNGEEGLNEMTRGPRTSNMKNSSSVSAEIEQPGLENKRSKCNLPEFQTEYEIAKFYVIKSYSEDDIHKCIKHDVWSSTPNGNKKLDAAFREAGAKTSETGKKCPVFLFFSVNGSGQFVGVAEMTGQVDFEKNMDFWQLDKWNGFFPIKWHIIKDVPNTLFRHIILEHNDNKPVTYSRDTQLIGLKQGLVMLSIFKNHPETTCVLDDFNFYEKREKSLKAKKNSKKHLDGGEGAIREESNKSDAAASTLISLTKNLSLNSQPLNSSI